MITNNFKDLSKKTSENFLLRFFQSKLMIFLVAISLLFLSYFIAKQDIIHDLCTVKFAPMGIALSLGIMGVFINTKITSTIKRIRGPKYPSSGNVIARKRHLIVMEKGKIWILRIFSLCCLEEVVFRYVVISELISISLPVFIACLISSILFAILHLNFRKLLEYFFLGLIFAGIFIVTNNIIYSIAAHFANNFTIYIIKTYIILREKHLNE